MNKTLVWTHESIAALFELPLFDLLYQAHTVHRQHFNPHKIQLSMLESIKTGACPEDCGYCSQSGHHNSEIEKEKLLDVESVLASAEKAKAQGASRFCMGAAWRSPPKKELPKVIEMIKGVKALGLETCVTLGMLDEEQTALLKEAGLDYYNHNLDTSPEFYEKIVTTRTYDDRLETLDNVRNAGIKVCCGGILGLGEKRADRVSLLLQLASLKEPPESVPINRLIPFKGTPLEGAQAIDNFEIVRVIAAARIVLPTSVLRLSAGRETMNPQMQALCFFAGANSIFLGEKLLTAPNTKEGEDFQLFNALGITAAKEADLNA